MDTVDSGTPRLPRLRAALLAAALLAVGCVTDEKSQPWFGVALPKGLGNPHQPVVAVEGVQPAPALEPEGEEGYSELEGERIRQDLEAIVGFSHADRAAGERMWGRVTGRPTAAATALWVAERFREARLENVEVQAYSGSEEMWWPRTWEVRLLADPAFGGGDDVVLESALPTSGSVIPGGQITAPVIDVGDINSEPVPEIDVTGKVAVQHLHPAAGAYSERRQTVERARHWIERGAAAVLNVVEQTGNMHVRDFSNCGGPCFNLGTADGAFLDAVRQQATALGLADGLRLELKLETETLTDLTGHNAVGIVPGRGGATENLIVNAHIDGWFDAAGDNGDGLAVLLALARHFALPQNRLDRTLVFVASGGHHSRGLNGPAHFVEQNPELVKNTVLALNLEHVAQLLIRSQDWTVDATEQPMSFGVDNEAPALFDLARRGMERYGFALNPEFRAAVPGDLGGYRSLGVPRVQAIHSGPMYHTSGDVLETISVPGLERAARFYAYLIRLVAAAERSVIQPSL